MYLNPFLHSKELAESWKKKTKIQTKDTQDQEIENRQLTISCEMCFLSSLFPALLSIV